MLNPSRLLTQAERRVLNKEHFEHADTIYDPVARICEMFPRNIALRFMGKNFSYRTLAENVMRLCNALRAAGLTTGEPVTVALPNIPESVYLLYATAQANLRFAPLHPLLSPDSVQAAMSKTGSRIVFTLDESARAVAGACPFAAVVAVSPAQSLGIKKFFYTIKHPSPKRHNTIFPFADFLKNNVSLPPVPKKCPAQAHSDVLLQSGGTTGTPKIIGLSAQSINNLAKKGLGILGLQKGTDCGMLSVLPVFHGFGLAMGVHAMLCHGGKNVLLPKFHRESAVKEIEKGNVQFIIGVPRLYEALLSHPRFCGKSLRSLITAFVGGDFVPHTLLKAFDVRIAQSGGTCRLHEGYGLTETVTVCSVNTACCHKDKTVGKPLEGLTIAAFDFSAATPVLLPSGEKGELAVAGDTLMEEYLSDEDATKNVFFIHDNKKYVRTGDCGYIDEDGFVRFLSRYKRIIKVRGVPVYPLEIEQLACAQEGVTDACVVSVPADAGEEVPVLFVEGTDETLPEKLRVLISNRLSPYAEPKKIILVRKFPQTNVGKTDTKKLLADYS